MKTSCGQLPAEICVCKSGAGMTFRIIQIAAFLGRKAKINIGYDLPLALAAQCLRGPLLWNYLMVVHLVLEEKSHYFFLKFS